VSGARIPRPPMLTVFAGSACIGFILARGKLGHEALDRDERSLGLFPTSSAAADAISKAVAS
jgi:hypothetical protein